MPETSEPVALWAGSDAPDAPLVVLLHGRGSDENALIGLAEGLPADVAYAAPRGPIALPDGGHTWFENEGLGRPRPDSLAGSITRVRGWLDLVAPAPRPVVVAGFSAGALFGGALTLLDPSRYAGFALLLGALPLAAGLAIENEPWTGLPVLAVHAERDEVMPPELMAETWRWVHQDSGAMVTSMRTAGGHAVTSETAAAVAAWLTGLFRS
jgi:phospholipase/carboxylesterase